MKQNVSSESPPADGKIALRLLKPELNYIYVITRGLKA
jgi:hypothetical protein